MRLMLIVIFILMAKNMFAQSDESEVLKHIPERAAKKIAKAEKLLKKGNEIMAEAVKYDDEIEANEVQSKKRKVRKLEKKLFKIKMKAAPYLEDGYKKKSKTLQKVLKESRKVNPQLASRLKETEVKSNKKIKQAKKLYRRAGDESSKTKSVKLYSLANKTISEAICDLLDGLKLVYGVDAAKPEDVHEDTVVVSGRAVEKDTLSSVEIIKKEEEPVAVNEPEASKVAAATAAGITGAVVTAEALSEKNKEETKEAQTAVAPESEEPVQSAEVAVDSAAVENVGAKGPEVFFTIQFIADTKPVSEELLRSKYSGDMEIVKMEADGWYRYSVGKFTDLQKAKEVMKSENIKGFIVAYDKGQRITITQAINLLKK